MDAKNKVFSLTVLLSVALWLPAQILTPLVDSIPMRDGKHLAADIYLPNNSDTFPVILIQTPYNRLMYRNGLPLGIKKNLAGSPYAFVIVDWRCFYGSSGACTANAKRGEDGYDVIDWIKDQPWCNGRIGTWGPSALGKVQYLTMREGHPNHTCAVPLVAGSQFSYKEYFPGGVARTEYFQTLDALGFGLSALLYANPVYNLFWFGAEKATLYPDSIKIPMLMVGGWYDHNINLMWDLFHAIRNASPAAQDVHILFGPWAHGGFSGQQVGTINQGELSYPLAAGWSDSLALRFFDYWLCGIPNGWDTSAVVRYYVPGEEQWKADSEWPPAGLLSDTLFLRGGGQLLPHPSTAIGDSSVLVYDPADPSPTWGGATLRPDLKQGPWDQSQVVESRNDILIFQTPVLNDPIRVRGRLKVHLVVKSDRKDTDFAIRLVDKYPDGRSMLISDGIQRMRFRNGYSQSDTAVMTPGYVYSIDLILPHTAYTFQPGHRLQLDITSSNWPRFDRNLNNGGPMYTAGDTLVAVNVVFHDQKYHSWIALPVTDAITVGKAPVPEPEPGLRVRPNPARDEIVVQAALGTDAEFRAYDLSGRLVGRLPATQSASGLWQIGVKHLRPGVYILSVAGRDRLLNSRLVILR